ncbi:molecular chaperone, partial [Serratia ureilytica]|nr:molecular chaperone [Serratia ureilytica]
MGAQAGIIASATRVIFREGDTEKTLMLLNTNGYPIVAQTWVDNGDVNAAPELFFTVGTRHIEFLRNI